MSVHLNVISMISLHDYDRSFCGMTSYVLIHHHHVMLQIEMEIVTSDILGLDIDKKCKQILEEIMQLVELFFSIMKASI